MLDFFFFALTFEYLKLQMHSKTLFTADQVYCNVDNEKNISRHREKNSTNEVIRTDILQYFCDVQNLYIKAQIINENIVKMLQFIGVNLFHEHLLIVGVDTLTVIKYIVFACFVCLFFD